MRQRYENEIHSQLKLSNNHTLNGHPFTDICDDLADSPLKSVGAKPVTAATAVTSKRTDELDVLAEALGIERGNPMSFEEANKMRGNPHFAEDEAYRVNC